MELLLSFLWFIRTSKVFLFYFYLWQLKEYQVKRFIDHFRTTKGKQLLFSKLNILKLILLICFLFFDNNILVKVFLILFLLFLYFVESVKTAADFFQKKLKIPVITVKTLFLIFAGFTAEIIILYEIIRFQIISAMTNICVSSAASSLSKFNFAFWLLFFDIISPLIASLIVISFQPIAVFFRNRTIKKAIKKREQFKNLIAVGITGSYGKTSTKEFLATILSSKFRVLKTKEHQNSEIAIARAILNDLKESHQIFIAEMGAYRKGGIKLLAGILKPKIGVITGINEQHLALFGTMENLISAEGGIELAKSLPEDGALVLNGNNEIIKLNIKNSCLPAGRPCLAPGRQISKINI
jgi:UDP-N-acetylmuramoyl-tripeptide--D-alanyl-D-alanine ligase